MLEVGTVETGCFCYMPTNAITLSTRQRSDGQLGDALPYLCWRLREPRALRKERVRCGALAGTNALYTVLSVLSVLCSVTSQSSKVPKP